MSKALKLTPAILKKIILEEKKKLDEAAAEGAFAADKKKYEKDVLKAVKETDEVEASEYAQTLEQEIDYQAALKIKEDKCRDALKKIREAKQKSLERIKKLKG